jgi:hypothetical protein
VSFDVAFFGTTANVERKHEGAIAVSIRFMHSRKRKTAKRTQEAQEIEAWA